jgi:hypothetical protein
MFCRSDRSDTKRLFGFFEEKGRAATPASFSHIIRFPSSAVTLYFLFILKLKIRGEREISPVPKVVYNLLYSLLTNDYGGVIKEGEGQLVYPEGVERD